jgi:hypothetical protein
MRILPSIFLYCLSSFDQGYLVKDIDIYKGRPESFSNTFVQEVSSNYRPSIYHVLAINSELMRN